MNRGASPNRLSPSRKVGPGGQSPNHGSPSISPKKSLSKTMGGSHKAEEEKGLSSPTSVTMQNSFIIKNADESFD